MPPAYRIEIGSNPYPGKIKTPSIRDGVFILAEDEGFEPPQTESESGVLPLHKSSMLFLTVLLYAKKSKSQALISRFLNFLF